MRTVNEYDKLKNLDAWGAIEEGNLEKTLLGYRMFENFCAGRNLRRVSVVNEFLPWLFNAKPGSRRWEPLYSFTPPFYDHCRYFIDTGTKQRVATIQPYIPTVARETGSSTSEQDFRCEALGVPEEFWDIYCDCVNARLKDKFKPLPDLPVVKETIATILAKAKKVSDEFADKHGLRAKVSFNGFYNPEQVILVEYVRRQVM